MSTIGFLLVVLLVALAIFLFCRSMGLWTRTIAWILSEREEKAALTRLKGHYNANGYLVGSDSDIRLDAGGSFRRFESVDSDSALEYSSIPPQPLRPAPVPPPTPPPPPIPLEEILVGGGDVDSAPGIQRAVSCESVCSDTSVAVTDLVEPNVTGYLCIGIEYDSECGDLVVSVIEAKDLVCREHSSPLLDTFVCVYLQPDNVANMQTRTYRSSNSPSYKEKFLFGLELPDFSRSWLMFHVYSVQREASTLLGEAHIMLTDVPTKQPITTWLTLADSNQAESNLGEILFSLSYLPTAERLTVVVVKARNLKFSTPNCDIFVKVYLLCNGKKVHKKKTSTKRNDNCPIFNEAMIFSVPCCSLQMLQVRVTVAGTGPETEGVFNVGHVILGGQASGKSLSHWNQMLASLRKPVAMWHPLRKKPNDP